MLLQKRIVILLFFLSLNLYAQSDVKIFGSVGYGFLSGNIPDISSFGFMGGVQFPFQIIEGADIKTEFIWVKNSKYFFPSSSTKYYSYITAFAISGLINQQIDENIYFEESIGYLFLSDKVYEFESSINHGINLTAALGIKLDKQNPQSNAVLFGFNYGLTFTNKNTSYFITYIQYKVSL
ncbi:MAG TPA: hypothetical protein PL041_03835 [Melioribacteraceae bacterium]|nr:hypothetical protein [Melioribacteraceae bacterium]